MKIRVLISCILALTLTVSWVTFAKAVVEDDQAALSCSLPEAVIGDAQVLIVWVLAPLEAAVSDGYSVVLRPTVFMPASQDRPPPAERVS